MEIGKGKNETRKIKHGQAQKKLTNLSGKKYTHIAYFEWKEKSK